MWTPDERDAVARTLLALADRPEIEEHLGRTYDLRSADGPEGVEYGGPEVGGWLRVRYLGERAVAVVFVPVVSEPAP